VEAEEKRCTVNCQLVSLATEPVYRPLLRADIDDVIADELEDILTGACCVRGDVAELFDRFPDGLDFRHVLRVDHTACSQQSRRTASSTLWNGTRVEGFGDCSGIADRAGHTSKVWLGLDPLVYLALTI
jgi:hypothetical protein